MNTKELMKIMAQDVFGPNFQQELQRRYAADVAEGRLGSIELRYAAAMEALDGSAASEQQALIRQYETCATAVRDFQGSFGFLGGLYCGFRQLMTADSAPDGGFDRTVAQELMTIPRLNRHQEMLRRTEEMESLLAALDLEEDLVLSITCAWEQRAYSAALHGFALGYRMALELCHYIAPDSSRKAKMLEKVLSIERFLGLSDLHQVS